MALETATPLYRAGGGVTLTAWSPDERNLFAATPSSLFRLEQSIRNLLPYKAGHKCWVIYPDARATECSPHSTSLSHKQCLIFVFQPV